MKYPFKTSLSVFLFGLFIFASSYTYAEVTYAIPLFGEEHQIGNMLQWETSWEKNSEKFVVEKSTDGINYLNIGLVEAAGKTSDSKSYRYLDINATGEKAFYRLRQMDVDGKASLSQTIIIKKVMQNEFMVLAMTNTVTDKEFKISIDAVEKGVLEYTVSSIRGNEVTHGELALEFGLNDLLIDLEDEKEGIYKIELKKGEELEQLVIQKVDDEIKKKENVASKRQNKGG